jgi:two-component system, OmpR family, response regulator
MTAVSSTAARRPGIGCRFCEIGCGGGSTQVQERIGARVLVVDDESRILAFVGRALRAEGFTVDAVSDGATAVRMATASAYDLVILDLAMPGLAGVEALQELVARRPQQPVLVLSARGDVDSKVMCLNLGADDYLTKPFSLDELLARVRARVRVGRRHEPSSSDQTSDGASAVAGLRIDVERQEVDAGSGPMPLSRREFLLLRELVRNVGRTVSKERLLSSVWGLSHDPGSNVVDVYVRRLRAKLGDDIVRTVRGEGYRIDAVE